MSIKVLIKRIIPVDLDDQVKHLYMEMRSAAMKQNGYIGGETLRRVGKKEEVLIISRWQTLDDWNRWLISNERRDYQDRIDKLIQIETSIEVYEN